MPARLLKIALLLEDRPRYPMVLRVQKLDQVAEHRVFIQSIFHFLVSNTLVDPLLEILLNRASQGCI